MRPRRPVRQTGFLLFKNCTISLYICTVIWLVVAAVSINNNIRNLIEKTVARMTRMARTVTRMARWLAH